MAFETWNKDQVTYPSLVLRQVRIIQDISKQELRNRTKIIKNLVGEQLIEEEDTRYSYLQAVDMLGSMLSPWFTTEAKKSYNDFVELFQSELKEVLEKKKEFKEECEKFFNLKIDGEIEQKKMETLNLYFLNKKIQLARKTFRDLILCYKDNDFLKSESYSEESDEGTDAFDEEGEE